MRLADFSALRSLEEDFPNTKHNASRTFDLPAPLGPSTQLKLPPKRISVCLAKDLKSCITILLILVAFRGSTATATCGMPGPLIEASSSTGILLCWYYLKVIVHSQLCCSGYN